MSIPASAPFRLSERPTEPELLAKYFRALGDPTRLRILRSLFEGEQPVGGLVERLGGTQSLISNHLACLRWCGFVATRREHRVVYYRIADERICRIIELGSGLLEDNADHVAACTRIDR